VAYRRDVAYRLVVLVLVALHLDRQCLMVAPFRLYQLQRLVFVLESFAPVVFVTLKLLGFVAAFDLLMCLVIVVRMFVTANLVVNHQTFHRLVVEAFDLLMCLVVAYRLYRLVLRYLAEPYHLEGEVEPLLLGRIVVDLVGTALVGFESTQALVVIALLVELPPMLVLLHPMLNLLHLLYRHLYRLEVVCLRLKVVLNLCFVALRLTFRPYYNSFTMLTCWQS
jgi:hypothetical protein